MKNKKVILIICAILIFVVSIYFLFTGSARTDVFLKDFEISADGKIITLKVGTSSSSGYIRKMEETSGSLNHYLTFYSTFGINSKLGASDTYELKVNSDADEIYFYTGDKGYKLVLRKNENGKWIKVNNNANLQIENIIDKSTIIEDFICATALEEFYEDDEYKYYYSCTKSDVVIVEYRDGSEETVKDALKNGNIKISDLDNYDIHYYKNDK